MEDGQIGATEYAGGNKNTEREQKVQNEMRKGERCRTYIVGVKDLASAYVLCPRLAEYGDLSIYGRTEFTEQRRDCECVTNSSLSLTNAQSDLITSLTHFRFFIGQQQSSFLLPESS